MEAHKCPHCQHVWLSTLNRPRACPQCKTKIGPRYKPITCKDCDHSWTPKTSSPKFCPNCSSPTYREGAVEKEIEKKTCKNCDYTWIPKTARPALCPSCRKSPHFRDFGKAFRKMYEHECVSCGHRWKSTLEFPARCPNPDPTVKPWTVEGLCKKSNPTRRRNQATIIGE